jgi:hypothetical protein
MPESVAARRAALMSLTLALVALAVLPLGLRAANRLNGAARAESTYLSTRDLWLLAIPWPDRGSSRAG